MAATSTRGVSISHASSPLNSMAFWISSLRSSSRPPSVSASSTIVSSSSSVIPCSASILNAFATSFFHALNRKFKGVKIIITNLMLPPKPIEVFSGISLARLLGVISPKMRIRTVVTTVAIVGPSEP